MILTIDIGNTNTVIGAFKNGALCIKERTSTNKTATDLEYAVMIKTALNMNGADHKEIEGAIISSVVPQVTGTISRAIEKYCGVTPIVVGPGVKTGLSIKIDNPAQLGSDLAVDAVAGMQEYPLPQIIIDMGTATTFSVIDKNGNYLGGAITTGMAVSTDALISRTSQLPRFSYDTPKKVIGTNTVDCLKSGIMHGNAAAIDGMIMRIEKELSQKCTVIATGGLAGLVVPLCARDDIIYDDELLLKGLLIIYNKNK